MGNKDTPLFFAGTFPAINAFAAVLINNYISHPKQFQLSPKEV